MSSPNSLRVLLGPQSPVRTIGDALASAGVPEGPLAVISAGWQEAEGDLDELAGYAGRHLEDLRVYGRVEDVTGGDPQLAAAVRRRQDKLIDLQRLYRLRLRQLAVAARRVLDADGDADVVAAEQRHAIAQLRALDRHHLHRSESIWNSFLEAHGPHAHRQLAQHGSEVGDIIRRSAGVVITGGNVVVLMNRMRLLGVTRMLDECNIIAWSAGAMVLTGRIVLFHDKSPEGRRDAEVLAAGCDIVPGYVCLPDAVHRLRTGDRRRIGLMSRRFAPDICVALDNQTGLIFDDAGVHSIANARQLCHDGRLARIRAA